MQRDLKDVGVEEGEWHEEARRSREQSVQVRLGMLWRVTVREGGISSSQGCGL